MARRPVVMMVSCFLVTGLALVGMINYRTENNAFKLWIPDNSDFVKNFAWLEENSPPDIRFNSLILTSDQSILTPEVLLHMFRLHQKVSSLVTEKSGLTWEKVCFDIPVVSEGSGPPQNCTIPPLPWLEPCYPDGWCPYINSMTSSACFEQSLLELWGYHDENIYLSLSLEDILDKINEEVTTSAVFNIPINVTNYLGEVTMENGRIVSAKATYMQWFGKINSSDIVEDDISDMGTGEIVDHASLEWEAHLRDLLMEDQNELPGGVEAFHQRCQRLL